MADAALVTDKIEAGEALVRAADAASVPLRAALWLYDSDEDRWRLVLEADPTSGLGLRAFAQGLHDAVPRIKDVDLRRGATDLLIDDVLLAIHPHPITEMLRASLGASRSVFRTRLAKTRVGRVTVDGAYLYRLERLQTLQRVDTSRSKAKRSATRAG